MIEILRTQTYKIVFTKRFGSHDLSAIAQIVSKFSLPNFASWRWTTLAECGRSLDALVGTCETVACLQTTETEARSIVFAKLCGVINGCRKSDPCIVWLKCQAQAQATLDSLFARLHDCVI